MCATKKTFFISGGGTGGHIYPAIAIAKALLEDNSDIYFIGNKKNLEYRICNENNLKFLSVSVGYMPRKFNLKFIFWGIKTFFAAIKSACYILKYKPSAVFATGGYVSAPILIASVVLKIPFMTHDCDSYPGIVSRVFSKYAKATSIAFEGAKKYLKTQEIYFYGNPIRKSFFNAERKNTSVPTLLIMGGSQGAKTLNDAGIGVIKYYSQNNNIKIILQTGMKNYDEVIKNLGEIPTNVQIVPYFQDLSVPLSRADLVVSRAGSLSISEICAMKLPSILVPYPYAAADHQKLNAKVMEQIGAAILLEDNKCTSEKLISLVDEILFDKDKLSKLSNAAGVQSKANASENIVKKIKEIAK